MLNAYGEAKYARLGNPEVWKHMTKPLKSGAGTPGTSGPTHLAHLDAAPFQPGQDGGGRGLQGALGDDNHALRASPLKPPPRASTSFEL